MPETPPKRVVTLQEFDHRTELILYDGLRHYYYDWNDGARDCLLEVIRRVEYRDSKINVKEKVKTHQSSPPTSQPSTESSSLAHPSDQKEYEDCACYQHGKEANCNATSED